MAEGAQGGGEAKPRRLLMDDFWVKVQHKTFGKWVSMHLGKRGIPPVTELDQAFKVGWVLVVFGAHRLNAGLFLGWFEVDCFVGSFVSENFPIQIREEPKNPYSTNAKR